MFTICLIIFPDFVVVISAINFVNAIFVTDGKAGQNYDRQKYEKKNTKGIVQHFGKTFFSFSVRVR